MYILLGICLEYIEENLSLFIFKKEKKLIEMYITFLLKVYSFENLYKTYLCNGGGSSRLAKLLYQFKDDNIIIIACVVAISQNTCYYLN